MASIDRRFSAAAAGDRDRQVATRSGSSASAWASALTRRLTGCEITNWSDQFTTSHRKITLTPSPSSRYNVFPRYSGIPRFSLLMSRCWAGVVAARWLHTPFFTTDRVTTARIIARQQHVAWVGVGYSPAFHGTTGPYHRFPGSPSSTAAGQHAHSLGLGGGTTGTTARIYLGIRTTEGWGLRTRAAPNVPPTEHQDEHLTAGTARMITGTTTRWQAGTTGAGSSIRPAGCCAVVAPNLTDTLPAAGPAERNQEIGLTEPNYCHTLIAAGVNETAARTPTDSGSLARKARSKNDERTQARH